MSTFNISKACASALQKACTTYTAEIFNELQRQGVMTETQVEVARKVVGASKVAVGKKSKAKKAKKAKVVTPTMLIPFCGEANDAWCCGVKTNHGLYTQCTKGPLEGEDYCKTCQKQSENGASGKPNGGDIRERVQQGTAWRDPKGKGPITYATLLAKPKFSALKLEDAEQAAAAFGWTIPDTEKVVATSKRGRPKKVVEVSDTDSEDGAKPKRKRGRPKKKAAPKQDVSNLIAQQAEAAIKEQALAAANEILGEESKTSPKKVNKKTKKVAKKAKKPNQKALKAQAFREKLLNELWEIVPAGTVLNTDDASNVEIRTMLKAAKDAKKAEEKLAKKLAAEKVKAEKKAAKELEKAKKKAAKEAEKAEKKAAKELEKQQKKDAATKEKLIKQLVELGVDNAATDILSASSATIDSLKALLKEKRKTIAAEKRAIKKAEKKAAKELEKQQQAAEMLAKLDSAATIEPDISDDELDEEPILEDLVLDDSEEQAYPFNPTTGQCTKEASGLDIDYYAICSEESFPNPVPDEDDEIILHDSQGEHIATYIEGVVYPVGDDEEE
jgi:hypothetical protein